MTAGVEGPPARNLFQPLPWKPQPRVPNQDQEETPLAHHLDPDAGRPAPGGGQGGPRGVHDQVLADNRQVPRFPENRRKVRRAGEAHLDFGKVLEPALDGVFERGPDVSAQLCTQGVEQTVDRRVHAQGRIGEVPQRTPNRWR